MAFQPKLVRKIECGNADAQSYRETRRGLLLALDKLMARIKAAETVRTTEEMDALLALERDRGLLVEMIAGCSYVIEWLETGRMPGLRRGIERRAGYQREIPVDPARMPQSGTTDRYEGLETEEERSAESGVRDLRLAAAMRGLSDRERDCFTLAQGQGRSYSEIAELLRIGKSSVGTYVVRAQRKIAANVGDPNARVG